MQRRFVLERDEDLTGLSGTGVVAEGVAFSDGKAVTRWVASRAGSVQTCVWDSVADVEKVHGHAGATRLVWLDAEDVFAGETRRGKVSDL